MLTLNELCNCFRYFSKESRVVIHFEHGAYITRKWEEACRIKCCTVKRFKVTFLNTKNIIMLEVWL